MCQWILLGGLNLLCYTKFTDTGLYMASHDSHHHQCLFEIPSGAIIVRLSPWFSRLLIVLSSRATSLHILTSSHFDLERTVHLPRCCIGGLTSSSIAHECGAGRRALAPVITPQLAIAEESFSPVESLQH